MVERTPRELGDERYDLLVVGAGINGAGIARDAALRGLRVAVVDKGDVASGTTSWSTRLIHGGLRYLEHFEVPLVRESLHERETLLRIAPHLVHPLSFFIPIYRDDERGPMLIRAGMLAYDALSLNKSLDRHQMLRPEAALEREPGIRRDGLRGAAVYYDAQAEYPERLALENALAAHDAGATVRTYARAERLLIEDGRVLGAEVVDERAGTRGRVEAALTLNVAGPWVDRVLDGRSKPLIGGTKGTHLVVERFPGAPAEALYVSATDGRPYFIVPWNDLYLIGTTDTDYQGDLDRVVATDEEIDYLVGETNRVIPGARLHRDAILYTYAGVRPLPHHDAGDEGSVTRGHIIHDHAPELEGLISIIGGKLTTYRNLAEETVDAASRKLGRRRERSRTADLPLPGAGSGDFHAFAEGFLAGRRWPERVARRLLRVYGARVAELVELVDAEPDLGSTLDEGTGALEAEVVLALRAELGERLTDVLMRRTLVGLGPDAGLAADERAAELAVRHAGWSEERARAEVEDFRAYVARFRPRAAPASAPAAL